MRNSIIVLLVIHLFMAAPIEAQVKRVSERESGGVSDAGRLILLQGMVMSAVDELPLPNAHYYINNRFEGSTDGDGKFALYIYRGDTLKFSFVGYGNLIYHTDSLKGASYVAGLFMDSDTVMIGEVVVFPRLGDLKSEFMASSSSTSPEMINATRNLRLSVYQGITTSPALGDPGTNYNLIMNRHRLEAYEKGGITSDRMLGINFISLIPASIYLLSKGFPEKPAPPLPVLSDSDLEKIRETYRKKIREHR